MPVSTISPTRSSNFPIQVASVVKNTLETLRRFGVLDMIMPELGRAVIYRAARPYYVCHMVWMLKIVLNEMNKAFDIPVKHCFSGYCYIPLNNKGAKINLTRARKIIFNVDGHILMLKISMSRSGKSVVYTVYNRGAGIEMNHATVIFNNGLATTPCCVSFRVHKRDVNALSGTLNRILGCRVESGKIIKMYEALYASSYQRAYGIHDIVQSEPTCWLSTPLSVLLMEFASLGYVEAFYVLKYYVLPALALKGCSLQKDLLRNTSMPPF